MLSDGQPEHRHLFWSCREWHLPDECLDVGMTGTAPQDANQNIGAVALVNRHQGLFISVAVRGDECWQDVTTAADSCGHCHLIDGGGVRLIIEHDAACAIDL